MEGMLLGQIKSVVLRFYLKIHSGRCEGRGEGLQSRSLLFPDSGFSLSGSSAHLERLRNWC